MSDQFGRQALSEAWNAVFGDFPTLAEIQLAQAVARGESNYGQAAFKNLQTGESRVINNWGAVQCGHVAPCGAGCFEATDHHADGSPYQACFRVYNSAAEGAAHFLKVLAVNRPSVKAALSTGSVDAVAHRMHETHYFELAEEKYANAIWKNANAIASNLGEELAVHRGDPTEEGGSGDPLSNSPSEPEDSGSESSSDDIYSNDPCTD